MKVMMHGASDCGSSNFGDFIYAEEIYRHIKDKNPDSLVQLYKPSSYFITYIDGYKHGLFSLLDADLEVYIPGGYFGEGHSARIRDNVFQFVRFMPFGLISAFLKKRMVIVGIGAGPLNSMIMREPTKIIMRNAASISVRDIESQKAIEEIGCNSSIEAGDMILAMNLNSRGLRTEQIEKVQKYAAGRKILLVHYNHSNKANVLFSHAVKHWLEHHTEYCVVVSADQVLDNESELFTGFNCVCPESFHFKYGNPYEFIELLKLVDTVLTCKLHVGVVGAMFNKSVLCFAEHPEKTVRFYRQIGCTDRFFNLYSTDVSVVEKSLERFAGTGISVPRRESERARKHWELLDRQIQECCVSAS